MTTKEKTPVLLPYCLNLTNALRQKSITGKILNEALVCYVKAVLTFQILLKPNCFFVISTEEKSQASVLVKLEIPPDVGMTEKQPNFSIK
ncbi:hypothetical protein [Spirosoma foliorum]|uniref:Uncharacterized protein n=1 Tax=Spirosoma foliorum TaxID=2710596 RepID=A0A7G5GW55_9BACT|nr:hypothetical protein [Spirosoma foliorum]QMW03097.1 hypothetical protein H3H32_35350 [Spirosoma foliorum]